MDRDTDLFIQAFWVKCREVVRPEIDSVVDRLRGAGHEAHVATQEFAVTPDDLPTDAGPSLTLAIEPAGTPAGAPHPSLKFRGDAGRQAIDVVASDGRAQSYEIAALGNAEVRAALDDWLARTIR